MYLKNETIIMMITSVERVYHTHQLVTHCLNHLLKIELLTKIQENKV